MTRSDRIIGSILAVAYFIFLMLWVLAVYVLPAKAQHNHERHHQDYLQWQSGKTMSCCNNRDCGALMSDEWAEGQSGAWVKIEGQWCSVLRQHYLTHGKSPDWNTAHACISQNTDTPPCERLLCFTGKGGF